MDLLPDVDYKIVYEDLPHKVKAFVTQDYNGFYTIVINHHISYYDAQEAIKHELQHLMNKDFDKFCVNDIEFSI